MYVFLIWKAEIKFLRTEMDPIRFSYLFLQANAEHTTYEGLKSSTWLSYLSCIERLSSLTLSTAYISQNAVQF